MLTLRVATIAACIVYSHEAVSPAIHTIAVPQPCATLEHLSHNKASPQHNVIVAHALCARRLLQTVTVSNLLDHFPDICGAHAATTCSQYFIN